MKISNHFPEKNEPQMKKVQLLAGAAAITLSTLAAPAFADSYGSVETACADSANKIAVMYGILTRGKNPNWKKPIDVLSEAQHIVTASFGETKWVRDEKWPGNFDWATVQVLQALMINRSPDGLRAIAEIDCNQTFKTASQ